MAAGAAGKNNNKHYYLLHWLFAFCGSAANKKNSSQIEEEEAEEEEQDILKKEKERERDRSQRTDRHAAYKAIYTTHEICRCAEQPKTGGAAHPHKYTPKGRWGGEAANKPNKRTATIESQRMESIFFALFPAFLPPSPASLLRALPAAFALPVDSFAKNSSKHALSSWLQPKLASRVQRGEVSVSCVVNLPTGERRLHRERERERASLAQLVILGTVAPLLYSYTTPLAAEVRLEVVEDGGNKTCKQKAIDSAYQAELLKKLTHTHRHNSRLELVITAC